MNILLNRAPFRSLVLLAFAMATSNAASQDGNEIGSNAFAAHCGACHISHHPQNPQAPRLAVLKTIGMERVRAAVGPRGRMRQNAQWLKPAELEAVILYLAGPASVPAPSPVSTAVPAASASN